MSTERVYVFAYGSNLCRERITARVGEVELVAVARLDGHELRFHKRSRDGSAKADAYATSVATDRVWGVVYSLSAEAKSVLDRYEGVGSHYIEHEATLACADGSHVRASFYAAHPSKIDPTLKPYRWYHRFVVEGARRHGIPADYVARIETVGTVEDPDCARQARELRLLEAAELGEPRP